jgi:type II secretory pathway pseudopilin PulG
VTLVELVVALTLFSVVATVMLTILRAQQRFQTGSLEIIDTKRNAHQAIDLLYGELRATASADIYSISDSSIAFRTTVGTSHVCSLDPSRSSLTLPGARARRSAPLSTFLTLPRAGDSLLIFDTGEAPEPVDDAWHRHVLIADPGGGICPPRPFGLAADATEAAGFVIPIAPPVSQTVTAGSPVRFFRPASYSLYRGTGATWMLGYSTCAGGTCTVRQPISGPYLPFAGGGEGGIAFTYFDTHGVPTTAPARVARIEIVARARSGATVDVGHVRGQHYRDSLSTAIALRNRS